jgi:hypothetical protein
LATPTVPVYDYSHAEPSLSAYTSMMLELYIQNLAALPSAHVLDIGPVCTENIVHFARRVKRFYVCDLFLRLNRDRSKGLGFEKALEYLDYAPGCFDGINLWDFSDHLKDDDISRLVKRCHALLVTGGMMSITSFEKQWAPAKTHSFVVNAGNRITFRLQDHLDLPRYYHSNRIMISVLSEFRTVKSFIYRNGVREFLCKND